MKNGELERQCAQLRRTKNCLEVRTRYLTGTLVKCWCCGNFKLQHIKDLLKLVLYCLIDTELHNHWKKKLLRKFVSLLFFLNYTLFWSWVLSILFVSEDFIRSDKFWPSSSQWVSAGLLKCIARTKTCYHMTLLHIEPYVFESVFMFLRESKESARTWTEKRGAWRENKATKQVWVWSKDTKEPT